MQLKFLENNHLRSSQEPRSHGSSSSLGPSQPHSSSSTPGGQSQVRVLFFVDSPQGGPSSEFTPPRHSLHSDQHDHMQESPGQISCSTLSSSLQSSSSQIQGRSRVRVSVPQPFGHSLQGAQSPQQVHGAFGHSPVSRKSSGFEPSGTSQPSHLSDDLQSHPFSR